jgi:hypothetical protein
MRPWLVLSFGALAAWGLWGLFASLASRRLAASNALVWEVVGAVLVAVVVLPVALRSDAAADRVGIAHAVLTGVTYTWGWCCCSPRWRPRANAVARDPSTAC